MQPETYYHIYNHANGSENLFREEENYRYFLQQWAKYIEPIAGTYCYCLMPNHIHFLIRLYDEPAVTRNLGYTEDFPFGKFKTFQKVVSKQFSNLFSSYTQAFNKRYSRRGSLFIPNFKRKEITTDSYLTTIVQYIHRNPVHHGFCEDLMNWPHSSVHVYSSGTPIKIQRPELLNWFGGIQGFQNAQQEPVLPPD